MIYRELFKFLKQSKIFFLFIIWLFCVSIAVGVLVQPANIVLFLNDYLNTLFSQIDGMNFLELLIYIFRNNVLTSFIGMIFGVFLGFYPLISIFINGYVIGWVSQRTFEAVGVFSLFSLVPHGIFELPALIISLGLGLQLGFNLVHNFIKKKEKSIFLAFIIVLAVILALALILENFALEFMSLVFFLFFLFFIYIFIGTLAEKKLRKEFILNLRNSLLAFVYVVIPLLIIAGIIETILIFFA